MEILVGSHQGLASQGKGEQAPVKIAQACLGRAQGAPVESPVIHPALVVGHPDVVENRSAGRLAETCVFSPGLPDLLPEVN